MNARQSRFVGEYLVDDDRAAAARRAGYAVRSARQMAAELLTNPNIVRDIRRRQREVAQRLTISHETVVRGLVAAFETARQQQDPANMIAACAKLAEVCGLYPPAPSRTAAVQIGEARGATSVEQLCRASNDALRALLSERRIAAARVTRPCRLAA